LQFPRRGRSRWVFPHDFLTGVSDCVFGPSSDPGQFTESKLICEPTADAGARPSRPAPSGFQAPDTILGVPRDIARLLPVLKAVSGKGDLDPDEVGVLITSDP
jgi:hypothetical protein